MTVVEKKCALIGDPFYLLPFEFKQENRENALRNAVFHEIEKAVRTGHHQFLCGFTAGIDFLFAETVLELREKNPSITLESVLAYESEAAAWDETIRDRYYDLLAQCSRERLLQTRYTPGCLVQRNKYLVDHTDLLLTMTDGLLGNAMQAIEHAAQQGKSVLCISPSTLATQKIS